MTTFVDRVELHVAAGSGGHGCASVHREKFKPLGGPDGGNGGRGGDVILVVDQSVTTLLDYHHSPHRKATNGKPGEGGNRSGKDGQDLVLPVPDGTVVLDKEGNVLADLVGQGTIVRRRRRAAAAGSATPRWPRPAARRPASRCSVSPARLRDIVLELKTVADVALVGYPSAGQVLADLGALARPSRRSPTTRSRRSCPTWVWSPPVRPSTPSPTCPGSFPGASQGKGLGLEFLRHVERCSRARARAGHGDAGVRPRPRLRPRHDRGGAAAVRRAGQPAAHRRPQQGRHPGRSGPRRHDPARPGGPRLPASSRCPPSRTRA